jgi:hypothetical protein
MTEAVNTNNNETTNPAFVELKRLVNVYGRKAVVATFINETMKTNLIDNYDVAQYIENNKEHAEEAREKLGALRLLCSDYQKDAVRRELVHGEQKILDDIQYVKDAANMIIKKTEQSKAEEKVLDLGQREKEEIKAEAHKILLEGRPVDYVMEIHGIDAVGASAYGRLLFSSGMCGTVANTSGLHPEADGESGIGKTHPMKILLYIWPSEYVVRGTFSDKSLFYDTEVKRGSIVYLNDIGKIPDDLARFIKLCSDEYQKPLQRRVVYDGEKRLLNIPPCMNWWITGVGAGAIDKQLLNRSINIGLDITEKSKRRQYKKDIENRQRQNAMTARLVGEETHEVLVAREMIKELLDAEQVKVLIPWLNDEEGEIMVWNANDNSRLLPIFLDLVSVSASIHRYQRPRNDKGNVVATLDDYDEARKIWDHVARETVSKLSKSDQRFIQALVDLGADENPVDLYAVEKATGVNYKTLYDQLHGNEKKGQMPLTDRFEMLSIIEETDTEFDKVLTEYLGHETEKKTGSKSRRRILLKLMGKVDMLHLSESVVTINRDRANKVLDKYGKKQQASPVQ